MDEGDCDYDVHLAPPVFPAFLDVFFDLFQEDFEENASQAVFENHADEYDDLELGPLD